MWLGETRSSPDCYGFLEVKLGLDGVCPTQMRKYPLAAAPLAIFRQSLSESTHPSQTFDHWLKDSPNCPRRLSA